MPTPTSKPKPETTIKAAPETSPPHETRRIVVEVLPVFQPDPGDGVLSPIEFDIDVERESSAVLLRRELRRRMGI